MTNNSPDPIARMEHGLDCARRQQYAAALTDLLWCFDVGSESDPSFAPVRRSFLLTYIAELGVSYPPAIAALRERRDRIENSLKSGAATEDDALDFGALNRVLYDTSRTVTVYDYGKLRWPERVRSALFSESVAPLVEAKRYHDVVDGTENVLSIVSERLQQTSEQLRMLDTLLDDVEAAESVRRDVIEEMCGYYEAVTAVGHSADAESIANAILAFEHSSRTFATLLQHAVRAGASDIAAAMARRGVESLPEEEATRLRVAIDALHLL